MKMLQVIQLVDKLIREGKTNDEIRRILFNTKGTRCEQIAKAMALISD